MKRITPGAASLYFALAVLATATTRAESISIDTAKSKMTVHVSKSGVFSALGHNHVIAAPIASGKVDRGAHTVELRVEAPGLRVQDSDTSERDRAEIQKTMLGPEVLDAERHQEILFRSTGVTAAGEGSWTVHGTLTLHGQTKPVTLEVHESNGHYTGTSRLRQSEFGIKPVKVAGGTVRVKDEVQIEFDIQLSR